MKLREVHFLSMEIFISFTGTELMKTLQNELAGVLTEKLSEFVKDELQTLQNVLYRITVYLMEQALTLLKRLLKHLVKWFIGWALKKIASTAWNQLGLSSLQNKIFYTFKAMFGHKRSEVFMI